MYIALTVLGFALIVLGIIAIALGLILGAREEFKKQNEGQAVSSLPEEFIKVLQKLLEASQSKAFFVGGILLVAIGLVMVGVVDIPTLATSATDNSAQ